MKKINKILFLLFLPLAAEILVACCDCVLPPPETYYYTNSSIDIINLDNSGRQPMPVIMGQIPREAYGMRLTFVNSQADPPLACHRSAFLLPAAHALKCECYEEFIYHYTDSIVAIRIVTMNDFDKDYPTGADISTFFSVHIFPSFFSIDEYIHHMLYADGFQRSELDLLLMTPPVSGREYIFKVLVQLSDGRELKGLTEMVELI